MNRRLLIAVDGSLHANQGLMYAADLLAGREDISCTLIHIQPVVSQYFIDEAKSDPQIQETLKRVQEHNRRQSEEILQKSKQILVDRGVAPAVIETVGKARSMGLAKDILEYAHTHLYDAIVAGRRGLARVQKIFMGSVSSKLAEYSGGIPLWVVDGDIRPAKFLVAVDITAPWRHILDHLAVMCAGLPELKLTFFHVMQNGAVETDETFAIPGVKEIGELMARNEKQVLDRFWEEATRELTAAGFKRHQLEMLAPGRSGKIGRMISDYATANNYDTVVIGRRGGDQAYYFGSVSRYVVERLSGCAVWVLG
ncbi:universal stress protein [Desulfatitalea alkaliphila]|uniref:Universal stress protein n=1 Tax=Desulfatitalea alkaliphila TaxID=2929485 RepID=A0AA41R3N0_9BACT|nr:universal stress protein [Desulfatitalea alkaliphila]MCJ8500410.1 universal stress protein [Desulfatitalea alkaliphila]